MAADVFRKALSGNRSNPLSGIAAVALQKVAERRLSDGSEDEVVDLYKTFQSLLCAPTYPGPAKTVEALDAAHVAPEMVLDHLIPDLSAWIGEQWISDDMSFARVTIIAARLQTLAWRYIEPMMVSSTDADDAPTVLMVVPEGETHILGCVLATGVLTREGVNATGMFCLPDEEVFKVAGERSYDAICLSTSGAGGADRLSPLIAGLRERANGALVAIGGSILTFSPQLSRELDGDLHSANPKALIKMLHRRLTSGTQRPREDSSAATLDLN